MAAAPKAWTPQEDQTLLAMYSSNSRRQIAAALGRTDGSVRKRCSTLSLNTKHPAWTKEETDALVSFYVEHIDKRFPPGGLAGFAERLGRTEEFVCRKAGELGLTDPTRLRREGAPEEYGARMKEWHQTHEHPRGAMGMKHTEETKASIGAKSRAKWADPAFALHSDEHRQRLSDNAHRRALRGGFKGPNQYTRAAGGARPDLGGAYFRSRWEANYARYLNLLVSQGKIVSWEYEPQVFEFKEIKRGTRSYSPDFKVFAPGGGYEWHEVKGWMDPKSRTRLARMAKFYPNEVIKIIGKDWFRSARRSIALLIPAWEYGQAKEVTAASQRPPRAYRRRASR